MNRFVRVHEGLDTAPMLAELAEHPKLWDEHPERRTAPGSPHSRMTDIWLRARARDDLADPEAFRLPHWPVFYPAWRALPTMHPIVWALMAQTKASHLGNVLITRLPPGEAIGTHVDTGWAPEWFTAKFYIVLKTNARCVNSCEGEEVQMRQGEIWQFENRVPHGVENNGAGERISLIVTMRVEQ